VASATGISERGRSSNNSSSTASTSEATGAPNTAAIPAAAPAASSTLRSFAVTRSSWPISEPMAPPVEMIGPSAPNGPPVPIANAEDTGLSQVMRAGMLDSLVRICSIASGMPCPWIAREPQRAMIPASRPPMAGIRMTQAPK
jgi:hypothetical protein